MDLNLIQFYLNMHRSRFANHLAQIAGFIFYNKEVQSQCVCLDLLTLEGYKVLWCKKRLSTSEHVVPTNARMTHDLPSSKQNIIFGTQERQWVHYVFYIKFREWWKRKGQYCNLILTNHVGQWVINNVNFCV